jgi:hypothetical protein
MHYRQVLCPAVFCVQSQPYGVVWGRYKANCMLRLADGPCWVLL